MPSTTLYVGSLLKNLGSKERHHPHYRRFSQRGPEGKTPQDPQQCSGETESGTSLPGLKSQIHHLLAT